MVIRFLPFVLFFFFLLGREEVVGQQLYNVTVNNDSPMIRYFGDWKRTLDVGLHLGYMIAQEANATALVEFQGVAIFFLLPWHLPPYDVSIQVQLDSQLPQILQLIDANTSISSDENRTTVPSQVVWGMEGLDDGQSHQLAISVPPFSQMAILDQLIITKVNESSSLSLTQTTAPGIGSILANTDVRPSPTSGARNLTSLVTGIGVGVALAMFATFLSVAIYAIRKRRVRLIGRARRALKVDLENDFPPIPKPRFSSSLRSCPRSTVTSFPLEDPRGSKFSMQTPQTQRPPSAHLIYPNDRPGKPDQPPPGYYDSVSPDIKLGNTSYVRITELYNSTFYYSHPASSPPPFDSIA